MISIAVPVMNERGNVEALFERVRAVLDACQEPFEIVFVDDGSTDGTDNVLRGLAEEDDRIRVIRFSRNFGHQPALSAALEAASGDAVISMDADLQHPPEMIPVFLEKWREGNQVVQAVRSEQKSGSWFKRTTSRLFYSVINSVSETQITPNAADFRLLDRAVVNTLLDMPENNRFLRGMVAWAGFRQCTVEYAESERTHGETKFSLFRMIRFAVNGITGFSTAPLRLCIWLGFISAMMGIPYVVWAVYARLFTDHTVAGWASLLSAIVFLGGIQLICIGILGEYIGRIYDEVKRRPQFVAAERIGFPDPTAIDQTSVRARETTADRYRTRPKQPTP